MLGFIIFIVASFLCWSWFTRRRPDEPPILPGAWPIIGHIPLIIGNSLDFMQFVNKFCDDCIKIGHAGCFLIGPITNYVLTDPDDIYKVANTCLDKDSFTRTFGEELVGAGLVFTEASKWKKHRKLITPTLNQQILDGFVPIFNSQARRLVKQLAVEIGGEPFDQSDYIRQNFVQTICLTLTDYEMSEEEARTYFHSFETFRYCTSTRFQKIWLCHKFLYQFSNLKKSQDASAKALQDIGNSILGKKKAELLQSNYVINKENNGKTFLDVMLGFDGSELTNKEVIAELTTMFTAGYDTVSGIAIIAFLMIGSYPEVQDKLYRELQEVFGTTDRDVEKQDFPKLVYLEAVLKETMRCYEVVPAITREIDQEVKLKNCTLQPGHGCLLLLNGVHRNPMWGPDANEFRPERWLDPDTLPTNPNAFVAFSLGKRGCIGRPFAMMTLKTVFSHVLRRYKIRSDHTKLVLKLDVFMSAVSGHEICLEDRFK